MINEKKLLAIFETARKKHKDILYYSFENFKEDTKSLLKDIENKNIICNIKPSTSGMSRKINFHKHYNIVLNIVYNEKINFKFVNISGCGMDMVWHLLYDFCLVVLTKKELEKINWNSLCSDYIDLSF